MARCGIAWRDVEKCGKMRIDVAGCSWMLQSKSDVAKCVKMWQGVAGCDRVRVMCQSA